MLDLAGKVAIVTGASSGLGAHFACLLAERGARVALAARRTDRLEAEVEAIERAHPGQARALRLDVTDLARIGPALDEVEADLGPISILVNNAGVDGAGLAGDVTGEDFDNTFAVNVRGLFFASREAALRMRASGIAAQGSARIINIASVVAFHALPGLSLYGATKAAVVSLTKSLAREWAKDMIAVNALCPGYIETEMNKDWFNSEPGAKQVQRFPRRRLMNKDALNAAFELLAGPSARSITGTALVVDDGQML